MSFKSEAAKVRSNIAAGEYKQQRDYFGGFVEQVAYGIRKRDEEKRQEELEKRRAARAEARRIAEEQRKADRELKAQEKLINGYLTVKGYDPTDSNKAAVRSVVTNLGITGFSDLDAVMRSNSTYLEGTPTGDVDDQMGDLVGTSGTIQFGKSEDKDPLEMSLDEVRFALSDPNLPASRRSVLERRQKSLIDPAQYTPTTLYKPDGSEVTARSLEEEQSYLKAGFSLVKGPEPADFADRTLYKEGASVQVYSQQDYNTYTANGWSPEKPPAETEFKPRTVYNEGTGQEREVFSQADLDAAVGEGFSVTKPAPVQEFDDRVLYKDGASVQVYSQDEYTSYTQAGWSPEKPPAATPFVTRTLYAEDGREQVVTSQAEMDAAIKGGFSAIKPADAVNFTARKLYMNGGEVEVFSAEEEKKYIELGYSREKPPKQEGFKQRTLYSESGAQVEVFTQLEMQKYIEEGFSAVKPAKVEPFKQRTLYKGSKTVQVYSEDEYLTYLKQGFGSVKTDFVARTYYKDGQEKRILSEQELQRAEAEGWSAVKLDDVAQIMDDLEVDRKTAAQIQNGTLKLTTDFAGRPIIVDIASTTSQPVTPDGQEEQPEVSSDLDALLTQINPNWKENGLAMMVNGEQVTFSPAEIQNNESFKVNADSLEGLDGAFGLSGVLNKVAGKAGDLVGAELRAEQNKAITFMGNLRLNTLINLAAAQAGGLRDSVWNKQQIIQTLPEPARLFEGPFEARNKTRETLRSIQTSLQLIEKAKKSGTISKTELSRSTITEASLRELERTYKTVLEAFDKSLGAAPKAQSSYIKKKDS